MGVVGFQKVKKCGTPYEVKRNVKRDPRDLHRGVTENLKKRQRGKGRRAWAEEKRGLMFKNTVNLEGTQVSRQPTQMDSPSGHIKVNPSL